MDSLPLRLSRPARCCAASPPGRARPPPPALPPSVGVGHERASGARVLFVGCVHGAAASADDVASVIGAASPDALVLELCRARLDALEAAMRRDHGVASGDGGGGGGDGGHGGGQQEARQPRQSASFAHLRRTFGGVGPAVVAALLNAVYDVQKRAGVDPGVEFKSALMAIREAPTGCRVVCGDADARDTVRELSLAVLRPLRSLRAAPASVCFLLRHVFVVPTGGVSIVRALAESQGKRVREFAQVFVPLVFFSYAVAYLGSNGVGSLLQFATPSQAFPGNMQSSNFLAAVGTLSQAVMVSYFALVTLSFVYVLIDARDRILARSIREAAAELVDSGVAEPVIVAVVGLLHVNGCIQYLQADEPAESDRIS